jgi:uncharacterized membrane protein
MQIALFVAYPLLAHLGVMFGWSPLQWLALQALCAGVLYRSLTARARGAWLGFLGFALATGALTGLGDGIYALYLPPLALTGLACVGFASSLRPGATPLVTRIATLANGPLPPAIAAHTRRVTIAWTILLAALLAITLALTVWGPRAWWSLFTNFITYALMGLMFIVEFVYRRWRYPDHDRRSFVDFIRLVARSGAGRA